jgi:hypothetical protein
MDVYEKPEERHVDVLIDTGREAFFCPDVFGLSLHGG